MSKLFALLQACILFVAASPERFQQVCWGLRFAVSTSRSLYPGCAGWKHWLRSTCSMTWAVVVQSQVLTTPGYLSLNQSHPRVGTAFVQACTQLLMANTG